MMTNYGNEKIKQVRPSMTIYIEKIHSKNETKK